VVWLIALPLAAYIEYESIRAEADVMQVTQPDPQTYEIKSSFWLFDRHKKVLFSDEEVMRDPPRRTYDLLVLDIQKLLLLWVIPLLPIWLFAAAVSWGRRSDGEGGGRKPFVQPTSLVDAESAPTQVRSQRKTILVWVGVIVALLLGGVIGKMVGRSASTSVFSSDPKPAFDQTLPKLANDLNRQLPMMVDRGTRLDSTVGGPGKRFTYVYTLVELPAADIDRAQLQRMLASSTRNRVCTDPKMEALFKNGVTVVYSYRGNDGIHVMEMPLTPSECGY
jgi:hypothetical protein